MINFPFEELLLQNEGDSPRLRGALAPHHNRARLTRPCFAYQSATGALISETEERDCARAACSNLIVPAVVIDISDRATATYMLSVEDIQNFESKHGTIPENSLVIVHTGWSRFWNQPDKYRNENQNKTMEFPAISIEAAKVLLKRNIAGIAIDTLSPDPANSDFPVHRLLLGAGKYIIENVANAEQLPHSGFKVIALPMKIEQATEAPVRMIALITS